MRTYLEGYYEGWDCDPSWEPPEPSAARLITGATGPTGPGYQGARGIRGETGPTGPTGMTGTDGIAVLAAYGTFVSIGTKTIENEPIPLDALLSNKMNLDYTPGDSKVIVESDGVYRITYGVKITSGSGSVVSLLINGQLLDDGKLEITDDRAEPSGVATVSLFIDDTIEIGVSNAAVTLDSHTSAFLDVMKIA